MLQFASQLVNYYIRTGSLKILEVFAVKNHIILVLWSIWNAICRIFFQTCKFLHFISVCHPCHEYGPLKPWNILRLWWRRRPFKEANAEPPIGVLNLGNKDKCKIHLVLCEFKNCIFHAEPMLNFTNSNLYDFFHENWTT